MGDTNSIQPPSAKLKRAICWIGETVREHPELTRARVIEQAQLRFDLNPKECEFLDKNFKQVISGPC